MALYTPFLADSAAQVGNAMIKRQVGELSRKAYMGDQQALGELYKFDPNAATQIRNQKLQEEQVALQGKATNLQMDATRQNMSQSAQEFALANKDRIEGILKQAAAFETYEQAQPYIAQQIEAMRQTGVQIPPGMDAQSFTPELFGQIKQAFSQKQEPYTLAPGQERRGPDNQVLATNTNRSDTDNMRDDKIGGLATRLANLVPNPRDVAADIVDGNIEVEVLEDGSVRLIDKIKAASGRGAEAVVELPVGSLMGGDGRVEPQTGQSLYQLAGEAGGIAGAARQVGSMLAGQFGANAYPETMEAYQTIDTAVSDMIRGMMTGDRFTATEANMLRDEIKITPSIMTPGPVAQARMRSVNRSLKTRLDQFERDASDPTLNADVRNKQRTNAANIRNFLDILGVPEKVPVSELTVPAIQEMNAGDVREAIRQITEEEFNQLSPEVVSAMMRKAGG